MKEVYLVLMICAVCVGTGAALHTDTGESWIRWNWSSDAAAYTVAVDGDTVAPSTLSQTYTLSNLQPNDEHRIEVYNESGYLLESGTATTLQPSGISYVLVAVSICFGVLALLIRYTMGAILCAAICFVCSGSLAMLSFSNLGAFAFLGALFAVLSGTLAVLRIHELFGGKDEW